MSLSRSISPRSLAPVLALMLATSHALGQDASLAAPGGDSAARAALQQAVAGTPAVESARARVDAARARLGASGRFADPEVELMASRANMPDDDTTMWEVNLRQPLPKRGERGADRARAEAAIAMAEADFALMAGEMAMDLSMAAAEIEAAERRVALLEAQVGRMEAVLASVDARLAAGGGRLADRLTVQTRIASMRLMIENDRRMAGDARSEMQARLGPALAAAGLPAFAAPPADMLLATDTAAVRLAAARESEAAAMKSMARASARPMTAVGLRLEREETRMGNEDIVGLAFMTEIPWRSRRYARAEERAANADAAAARAEGASARLRLEAAIARAERAARVAAIARQLGSETRARLEAELDALIQAASAGGAMAGDSTVLMTVEILEKTTETELQVIDAETQARLARAALWVHAPVALWADTLSDNDNPSSP